MKPGPNWNRWGADDERGTANLLTSEYVRNALAQPVKGRIFGLGVVVGRNSPNYGRAAPLHLMSVDGADYAALGRASGFAFTDDYLFMACHSSTHLDALAHVISDGHLYNGFSATEVRSTGAARCGIDRVGGLVARAHVLDVAGERGLDRLTEGDVITADELATIGARGNISFQPGDAVLVRTGFIKVLLAEPGRLAAEPGLDPSCAEWIGDMNLSLIGVDNSAAEQVSARPSDLPFHRQVVAGLGCYILEMIDLEEVVEAGVSQGLLVVAPLRIQRGVGSPVNPILIA